MTTEEGPKETMAPILKFLAGSDAVGTLDKWSGLLGRGELGREPLN